LRPARVQLNASNLNPEKLITRREVSNGVANKTPETIPQTWLAECMGMANTMRSMLRREQTYVGRLSISFNSFSHSVGRLPTQLITDRYVAEYSMASLIR